MTEAEWMACNEPEPMLPVVAIAARKLRLFALACCERIDHLITDPRSRAALEFATRHVETPINRQRGRAKVERDSVTAQRWATIEGCALGIDRAAECAAA